MAKSINKKQEKKINKAIDIKDKEGNSVSEEESLESEVEQEEHNDSEEEAAETDEGVGEEEEESDETQDKFDLAMSETSSSDGEDELEEDDEEEQQVDKVVPSKAENISIKIQQRYDQFKGKRLYVRFPEKLPEQEDKLQEKAKALSPLIKQVHRPRQKHARFCLVDFASQADRDTALESIRNEIKESKDENFKRIVIDVPRTESHEFVQNLVEKKLKTLEKKRANRKLKKISLVAEKNKKFTSTLVVTNLPKATSVLEVRTAFPKAIDVRIKRNKAAVTFPTTYDARLAYKQPPSVSGIQLKVRFDKLIPRKRKPQIKKVNDKDETVEKNNNKRALGEDTAVADTTVIKKKKQKTETATPAENKPVKKKKKVV